MEWRLRQENDNRSYSNQYNRYQKGRQDNKYAKKQGDETMNLASEVESPAEDADDTVSEYMAFREMTEDEEFARFIADREQAKKEGNC